MATPPPPPEWAVPLEAWRLLGGLDWAALDWAVGYLGVTDLDGLILDLMEIQRQTHG